MIEIKDFKTFEEFQVFIRSQKDKMPYWTTEEISSFNQKVYDLKENSPEFREKYDAWVARLELKERAKSVSLKIGNQQDEIYSKAYLKLKKYKKSKTSKTSLPVTNIREI